MLHFEGSFSTKERIETVFGALLDPNIIAVCLPDSKQVRIRNADTFDIVVKIGVGFVKGSFTFHFSFLDKEPSRHARLKAQAKGSGSTIELDAKMNLREVPEGTMMKWEADVKVDGLIATVSQRLIRVTGEKAINQIFSCIKQRLEEKPTTNRNE